MSGEPVEIKVAQSTMDLAAEAMREAVAELTRLRAENATLQSQALQMAEAIGRVDEWQKVRSCRPDFNDPTEPVMLKWQNYAAALEQAGDTLESQLATLADAVLRVDEWAKEEHRRQRVRAEKHSIVGKSMMFLLKLVRGELAGEDGEVITIATAVREASHD